MTQVNLQQVLISALLFGIGVPVYVLFAPKKEVTALKKDFLSRDAILERAYRQGEVYLANVVRHVKRRVYRAKHIQEAWKIQEER